MMRQRAHYGIALLVHVGLIGIPFRFGAFLFLDVGKTWLGKIPWIANPCTILSQQVCSRVERAALGDFGFRFLEYFGLVSYVVFRLHKAPISAQMAFHRVLAFVSGSVLIVLVYSMENGYFTGRKGPLDNRFCALVSICYALAIVLSIRVTTLCHPQAPIDGMKWSIPANAIFFGGVSSILTNV